jgi:hypothetical protein
MLPRRSDGATSRMRFAPSPRESIARKVHSPKVVPILCCAQAGRLAEETHHSTCFPDVRMGRPPANRSPRESIARKVHSPKVASGHPRRMVGGWDSSLDMLPRSSDEVTSRKPLSPQVNRPQSAFAEDRPETSPPVGWRMGLTTRRASQKFGWGDLPQTTLPASQSPAKCICRRSPRDIPAGWLADGTHHSACFPEVRMGRPPANRSPRKSIARKVHLPKVASGHPRRLVGGWDSPLDMLPRCSDGATPRKPLSPQVNRPQMHFAEGRLRTSPPVGWRMGLTTRHASQMFGWGDPPQTALPASQSPANVCCAQAEGRPETSPPVGWQMRLAPQRTTDGG